MPISTIDSSGLNQAGNTVLCSTSGNVGIGTSSPAYKLDVATIAVAINQTGVVRFGANDQYSLRLGTYTNAGGTPYAQILAPKDAAGWLAFTTGTSDTERARIDSSGRVTTPYQPAFYAAGITSTLYTAGQLLNFSTAPLNRGSYFNTGSSRFTAPVSGVYVFCVGIYVWSGSGTSTQSFAIRVNGSELTLSGDTTIFFSGAVTSGDNMVMGSIPLSLNQGDYVTINLRNSAPSLNLYSGHSFFAGYLLG